MRIFVKETDKMRIFLKKKEEKVWWFRKKQYLCNRI